MLILASATDRLQLVTGSAGAIDVHASWMDNVAGAVNPGRTNTAITTATTTTITPSPAASVQRNVKTLHVRNRGNSGVSVTVVHTDGTIAVELYKTSLDAGDTLQYIDEVGFVSKATQAAAGGFTTGDIRVTVKTIPDPGWLIMNDTTIGPLGSGSAYSNNDAQALFNLFFFNLADSVAPMFTSTGIATTRAAQGSAANAWTSLARITMPRVMGRALGAAGAGAGLSSRFHGLFMGAETESQTEAQLATHWHYCPQGIFFLCSPGSGQWLSNELFDIMANGYRNTENAGGGQPLNIMQPTVFFNWMIKL